MRTKDVEAATIMALSAGPLEFALENGAGFGHPRRTVLENMLASPGNGGVAKDPAVAAAALSLVVESIVARLEAQDRELERLRERIAELGEASE